MLIVDPSARSIEWYAQGESGLQAADGSRLFETSAAELFNLIDLALIREPFIRGRPNPGCVRAGKI